jgi:hypothetical protein
MRSAGIRDSADPDLMLDTAQSPIKRAAASNFQTQLLLLC